MALKALLFDVDGTLADTEPHGHLPAYNKAFNELGLGWKWSRKLYRTLLLQPGGRERLSHYIDEYDPDLGDHQQAVDDDQKAWVNELHATKSKHFGQLVEKGKVPLRPGVRRLIEEAHAQDIRVAIVSNASRASLDALLGHVLGDGLMDIIDFVQDGEQVKNKKPAPDAYQQALKKLSVNADECLAIEDSDIGNQAALAAGIGTIITVNADTRHHEFPGALLVVDKLGEPASPCRILQSKHDIDPMKARDYVDTDLLRDILKAESV